MNPWLIAALAGLGLVAVSSSGAPAPAMAPPPPAPVPQPSRAGAWNPLSSANIKAAVAVALKSETSPTALQLFGSNLLTMGGYDSLGSALINRSAAVLAESLGGGSSPSPPDGGGGSGSGGGSGINPGLLPPPSGGDSGGGFWKAPPEWSSADPTPTNDPGTAVLSWIEFWGQGEELTDDAIFQTLTYVETPANGVTRTDHMTDFASALQAYDPGGGYTSAAAGLYDYIAKLNAASNPLGGKSNPYWKAPPQWSSAAPTPTSDAEEAALSWIEFWGQGSTVDVGTIGATMNYILTPTNNVTRVDHISDFVNALRGLGALGGTDSDTENAVAATLTSYMSSLDASGKATVSGPLDDEAEEPEPVCTWVNHYIGTDYQPGERIETDDLTEALQAAAIEADPEHVAAFGASLQAGIGIQVMEYNEMNPFV